MQFVIDFTQFWRKTVNTHHWIKSFVSYLTWLMRRKRDSCERSNIYLHLVLKFNNNKIVECDIVMFKKFLKVNSLLYIRKFLWNPTTLANMFRIINFARQTSFSQYLYKRWLTYVISFVKSVDCASTDPDITTSFKTCDGHFAMNLNKTLVLKVWQQSY